MLRHTGRAISALAITLVSATAGLSDPRYVPKDDKAYFCRNLADMPKVDNDPSVVPESCQRLSRTDTIEQDLDVDLDHRPYMKAFNTNREKGWMNAHKFASYDFPEKFKTGTGAVICINPLRAKEGLKAAAAADVKWMRDLGCSFVSEGIPAMLATDEKFENKTLWNIRLMPTTKSGVSGWAYYTSIVAENGDRLNEFGRRENAR